MDRRSKQKINKGTLDLSYSLDQMEHSIQQAAEYILLRQQELCFRARTWALLLPTAERILSWPQTLTEPTLGWIFAWRDLSRLHTDHLNVPTFLLYSIYAHEAEFNLRLRRPQETTGQLFWASLICFLYSWKDISSTFLCISYMFLLLPPTPSLRRFLKKCILWGLFESRLPSVSQATDKHGERGRRILEIVKLWTS